MTLLHVRLLGGFELSFDDKPIVIKTQKAKGLLAYLVLHQDVPLARGQLATLLWPEQTTEKAAHSLRQALSTLRKSIPNFEVFCLVERTQLVCTASTELVIDVQAFENACELEEETAVGLYSGPFLDGFFIHEVIEYETWLLGVREKLQNKLIALLEKFSTVAQTQNRWADAQAYLHKLLKLDPWHEPATQKPDAPTRHAQGAQSGYRPL